jgi:hypothetical protein
VTPAEELSVSKLQDHVLLKGSHLADVVKAVANSGTTKGFGPVSAEIARLYSLDLFDCSPFDESQLLLVEPQLITAAVLHKGGAFKLRGARLQDRLEELMLTAEGYVLEALVRKDLVQSLICRLGLQGMCGQCTCHARWHSCCPNK